MHRNDWTGLPYFLAVARNGSLRRAAEALSATHTTVDRNLKALEASYGTLLFKRSRRGYTLTQAGWALLPRAEAAELEVQAAHKQVAGADKAVSGMVRLSTSNWLSTFFITPMLDKFSQTYPEIDLSLSTTDRFQDFSAENIDVSLRVAFDVTQDVVARRLFSYDVSVFASQQYLDSHWDEAGREGQGLHWVGWDGPEIDKFWQDANLFPRAKRRHRITDGMLLGTMIAQGLGMGIYPVFIEHIYPNVTRVPGTPIKPDRSLWLLLHSDLRKTRRVRAVVDFLAEELITQKSKFQQR